MQEDDRVRFENFRRHLTGKVSHLCKTSLELQARGFGCVDEVEDSLLTQTEACIHIARHAGCLMELVWVLERLESTIFVREVRSFVMGKWNVYETDTDTSSLLRRIIFFRENAFRGSVSSSLITIAKKRVALRVLAQRRTEVYVMSPRVTELVDALCGEYLIGWVERYAYAEQVSGSGKDGGIEDTDFSLVDDECRTPHARLASR